MKRTIPLLIGFIVGSIVLISYFVDVGALQTSKKYFLQWGQVLAAAAYILGGISIMQVNWPKIRRKEEDWQYKVILLAGAGIMLIAGISWPTMGEKQDAISVVAKDGPGQNIKVNAISNDPISLAIGAAQIDLDKSNGYNGSAELVAAKSVDVFIKRFKAADDSFQGKIIYDTSLERSFLRPKKISEKNLFLIHAHPGDSIELSVDTRFLVPSGKTEWLKRAVSAQVVPGGGKIIVAAPGRYEMRVPSEKTFVVNVAGVDIPAQSNCGNSSRHVPWCTFTGSVLFQTKKHHGIILQHQQKGFEKIAGTLIVDSLGDGKVKWLDKPDDKLGVFTISAKPGSVLDIKASPRMLWGNHGRMYQWLYDYVFAPANATMFSLLAFFIASAAFRAFRAHNLEAGILLCTAILLLLGRATIGAAISPFFPEISDWIMNIPNNAGYRAIMMGAALGGIATGLRIILGLERSHLGGDA